MSVSMDIDLASITDRRDLRTGTPVWAISGPVRIATHQLSSPTQADVVIVGAGITGALLAEAATARGLNVLVIDRRLPFHGSTAASTALLQFELDTPLVRLAAEIGFEKAQRAWWRSFRAIDNLATLVRQLGLRCAFRRRRSLYLTGNTLGPAGLAEEGKLRRAIGLPSAFLATADLRSLAGIDREGALLSDGAADVNPVLLTRALLRRAMARGARVYSPVELAAVHPSHRRVQMVTSDGIELQAKALVFATGYELARGVPLDGHRITSTWAFATKPQAPALWSKGELIWEAADPYLYLRTTSDGRVLVGGEDEDIEDEATRDALLPAKILALQEKTKRILPWLDVSADCAWAGTFGESNNGLPSIGAVPGMPGCYAVLGYGGNGLTFGVVAAQIIAQRLCGTRDADEELFGFGR
jgi:glycine/D-amino acid oxidase-like deaminating enzyme